MKVIPLEKARERYLTDEEIYAQTPKGCITYIDGKVTQSDLDILNEITRNFMRRHGIPVEEE